MPEITQWEEFTQLIPETGTVWLVGAMGLVYCFLGYRLFRFVLALTGFVLAAVSAGSLGLFLSEGHAVATIVAGLIGGICGAMALHWVYRAGIFIVGLLGGTLIALHVVPGLELEKGAYIAACYVGAALFGGGIALSAERFAVTVMTALIGAWLAVGAGSQAFADIDFGGTLRTADIQDTEWITLVGIWVLLALAGALVQLLPSPQPKRPSE